MKTTNMKATIRIFRRRNSIAVRILHAFELEAEKTVEINRRVKALVRVEPDKSMAGLIDGFKSYPSDFLLVKKSIFYRSLMLRLDADCHG